MSEIKSELNDLLSECSELDKESREILSEFDKLISDPSKNNASQQRDELIDKTDEILLKSEDILEKLWDLSEITEPNLSQLLTIGGLIKEKCDMLCDRDDEIYIADEKLQNLLKIKRADEKLQKLLEIEEEIKRADTKEEIKQADEKLQKLIGKKETRKSNSKIKTALYFGSIFTATLAYLMSNKLEIHACSNPSLLFPTIVST